MSRFPVALALILIAVALLPDAAAACSVCYGGAEESRKAFLFTTVLLSMLPISMIGVLAWWVWRSARETEAQPAPPSRPTPIC